MVNLSTLTGATQIYVDESVSSARQRLTSGVLWGFIWTERPYNGHGDAKEFGDVDLINYLTSISFGLGASESTADVLRELGVSRPLVISDHGIKAAGLLDSPAFAFLKTAPVFLDVPTNPTESAVVAGLELYRQGECDGVVAIGGGSPIDLAKGVALLATHEGELEQYAAILGGVARIKSAVAPLVAIPTTAGTGSEVGRAALITLNDGRKLGFISPFL